MDMQQMLELILASQEKAEADRERDSEDLKMNGCEVGCQPGQSRKNKCQIGRHLGRNESHSQKDNGQVEYPSGKDDGHPGAMEAEPDPQMMHSIGEHQEIPKGEVTVKPVRGLRK
jgi:hypothetical protein